MTATYSEQVRLSVWKSWIIRKRSPVLWLFEIIWPILLLGTVCLLQLYSQNVLEDSCQYRARANPSVGDVPYFQSAVCNLNNLCLESDQFEQIPTYNESSLSHLYRNGTPIIMDGMVSDAFSYWPTYERVFLETVNATSHPTIINFFSDSFPVADLFIQESELEDFLTNEAEALTPQEAADLFDSNLNWTNIISDFNWWSLSDYFNSGIGCYPNSFDDYLHFEDVSLYERLSNLLCEDYDDLNDFIDFLRLLVTNLNQNFIANEISSVLRLAREFEPYDLIGDIGEFAGIVWNIPEIGNIEPVLHLELWFHELQELFESIVKEEPHYKWTVLDSLAELTFQYYMNESDYEQLVGNVTEVTNLLIELNQLLTAAGPIENQANPGPWESLGNSVENVIRTLINDQDALDCLDNAINGIGGFPNCDTTRIREILQEIADILGWNETNDQVTWVDYAVYFAEAIQLEFADPNDAQLITWTQLRQPMFETFMITYANLSMLDRFIVDYPYEGECLASFESYFIFPLGFAGDNKLVKDNVCLFNDFIAGYIEPEELGDIFWEKFVNATSYGVPPATTDFFEFLIDIEDSVKNILNFNWTSYDDQEWSTSVSQANEVFSQNDFIHDIIQLTHDVIFSFNDAELEFIGNATVATIDILTRGTNNVTMELNGYYSVGDGIIFTIADFFNEYPALHLVAENSLQILPNLMSDWAANFRDVYSVTNGIIDAWLSLIYTYDWPCGYYSIADKWNIWPENKEALDQLEVQLCDFDQVVHDIESLPWVAEVIEIWNGTSHYDFDWFELEDSLSEVSEEVDLMIDHINDGGFHPSEIDRTFQRSGAELIWRIFTFTQELFDYYHEYYYYRKPLPENEMNITTFGSEDIFEIIQNCNGYGYQDCHIHNDISGLMDFIEELLVVLDYYNILNNYRYTWIWDFVAQHSQLFRPLTRYLKDDVTQGDLGAALLNLGLKNESVSFLMKSGININRFRNYPYNNELLIDFFDPFPFSLAITSEYDDYYNEVEILRNDILASFNEPAIGSTLLNYLNMTKISNEYYDDAYSNVFDFDWVPSYLGIMNHMMNDVDNLVFSLASFDFQEFLRYSGPKLMQDNAFGLIEGLGALVTEIMNDVVFVRNQLPRLKSFELLEKSKLWFEIESVINFDEMEEFLLNLGFSKSDVNKVAHGKLKLSILGVLSSMADSVCDNFNLRKYIVLPPGSSSDINQITAEICYMPSEDRIQFVSLIFQQLNVDGILTDLNELFTFLRKYVIDYWDSDLSNAIESASYAIDAINDFYEEEASELYYHFEEFFYNHGNNLSSESYAGLVACGDEDAFNFDLGSKAVSDDESNPKELVNLRSYSKVLLEISKNGNNIRQSKARPEKDGKDARAVIDQCERFQSVLSETDSGRLFWTALASLFQGDILYTPKNDFTDSVMSRANLGYQDLGNDFFYYRRFFEAISAIGRVVENDDAFELIKIAKSSPVLRSLFQSIVYWIDSNDVWRFLDELDIVELRDEIMNKGSFIWEASELIEKGLECYQTNRMVGMTDIDEFEQAAIEKAQNSTLYAAIEFLNTETNAADVTHARYKIRMSKDDVPSTSPNSGLLWLPNPKDSFYEDLKYLHGFVQVQDMLDRAFVDVVTDYTGNDAGFGGQGIGVFTQQQPIPCRQSDSYIDVIQTAHVVQLCLFFGFALTVVSSIRFQVLEKETFNFSLMQAMGLRYSVPWLSWSFIPSVSLLLLSLILTLIVTEGGLFPLSNSGLVFSIIFVYAFSLIAFSLLMSSLLSKATTGAVISLIAFFFSFVPFFIIVAFENHMEAWSKMILYVFMSTSFSHGLVHVSRLERQGIGLQTNNVWNSPLNREDTSFGTALLFTFADAILYFAIAMMILKIKSHRKSPTISENRVDSAAMKKKKADLEGSKSKFGVELFGLSQRYPGQEKLAVDRLNLSFKVGEVTALLGPNGAGKSATLKMLTGLEEPTSGRIEIWGYEYPRDWQHIQKILGFCPQNNILFPDMTIMEHLEFYGNLKGIRDRKQLKQETLRLLKAMDLEELRNSAVNTLPVGIQRRLCVGLAFIGNSKVVILDEPTSGVDPIARRAIWSLIEDQKQDRTIILTTHYLDEAEILGDTIAILHQGRLLAEGSFDDLRRSIRGGQQLKIISKQASSKAIQIESQLKKSVPNIKIISKSNEKLKFFIPENTDLHSMHSLTDFLDNQGEQYFGITDYSIRTSSLKEIFIGLIQEDEQGLSSNLKMGIKSDTTNSADRISLGSSVNSEVISDNNQMKSGLSLTIAQIKGLFFKRWKHFTRNWRFIMCAFILPLILFTVALSTSLDPSSASKAVTTTLLLTPSLQGPDANGFIKKSPSTSSIGNSVIDSLLSPPGIGTTCMEPPPIEADYVPCLENADNDFTTNYTGPGSSLSSCTCSSDSSWTCSPIANSKAAPRRKMRSTDIIFDVSIYENLTAADWILSTYNDFLSDTSETRFGGWAVAEQSSSNHLSDVFGSLNNIIAWFNNRASHALPSYVNAIHNAILRKMAGDAGLNPALYGITAFTQPLDVSTGIPSTDTILDNLIDFGVAFLILGSFCLSPSSFLPYLIGERIKEERQVQRMSGVSSVLYWITSLLWDSFMILIFLLLTTLILLAFNIPSFTAKSNLGAYILLVLFFCLAATTLGYCLQRLFSDSSMGQLAIGAGFVLTGVFTMTLVLILESLISSESAQNTKEVLNIIFMLLPPYALGNGLVNLAANQVSSEIMQGLGMENAYIDPFSTEIIGINVIVLACEMIVFFLLNLALENKWFSCSSSKMKYNNLQSEDDEDVSQERKRIENGHGHSDLMTLMNLSKRYSNGCGGGNTEAVSKMTIGVQKGECLGWLGVNGSGKTTAFRMLTGATAPSGGSFWFNQDVSIGYCPQENSLDSFLTVKEMLYTHCLIRGMRTDQLIKAVSRALGDFALESHKNAKCSQLSGGTKRKLCTAIAFLGDPDLILLDEPTSGMDVLTQREVWHLIRRQLDKGHSVVLTSQSMEECDQLCSRVAIMDRGRLVCLGSPRHLKNKFHHGFTLTLRTQSFSDARKASQFIRNHFSSFKDLNQRQQFVRVNIQGQGLSHIYRVLAPLKNQIGKLEVSIKPTTFDELFLKTRDQWKPQQQLAKENPIQID